MFFNNIVLHKKFIKDINYVVILIAINYKETILNVKYWDRIVLRISLKCGTFSTHVKTCLTYIIVQVFRTRSRRNSLIQSNGL